MPVRRFMQDNDPKHTSKKAVALLAAESINWWKSPAESPDSNPIENLWHKLKEYILSLTFTCLLDTVPAFLPYPFEYMPTLPVLWELWQDHLLEKS